MKIESEAVEQSQSVEFTKRTRQARELAKDLTKTKSLPSNAAQSIAELLNTPPILVVVRCTRSSRGWADAVGHRVNETCDTP
jgi:hypothetical protein